MARVLERPLTVEDRERFQGEPDTRYGLIDDRQVVAELDALFRKALSDRYICRAQQQSGGRAGLQSGVLATEVALEDIDRFVPFGRGDAEDQPEAT